MFKVKAKTNLNPSELYSTGMYDGDGLYLNDDGVMYNLVSVQGSSACVLNVPRECIVEVEDVKSKSVLESIGELSGLLKSQSNKIISLDKGIDDIIDLLQQDKPQHSGGGVDIKDLTKLIAVAQKPELLDKKV